MKYRAKCTKCESMISTLYRKPIIVHESDDDYIEVRTEEEADLIETINNAQRVSHNKFIELAILLIKKNHERNSQ